MSNGVSISSGDRSGERRELPDSPAEKDFGSFYSCQKANATTNFANVQYSVKYS